MFRRLLKVSALLALPLFVSAQENQQATPAMPDPLSIVEDESLTLEQRRAKLQAIANENPNSADAWAAYGEILEQLGENETALRAFEKAIAIDTHLYSPWLWIGILNKRGTPEPNLERAEQAFRRALEEGAPKAQALNELAVTLAIQGRIDEAIDMWRQAIAADPDWGALYSNMMKAATRTGDEKLALEYLDGAIAAARFEEASVMILGEYFARKNDHDDAIDVYGKALVKHPNNTRILFYRGLALAEEGESELALAELGKASEFAAKEDPADAELIQSADWEMFRIRNPKAEKDFQKARKLVFDPEDNARKLEKNLNKAVDELDVILVAYPDFWNGFFVRGVAQRRLDNRSKARADFERVLELMPGEPNATMELALMMRDEGSFNEAAKLADQAVTLAPRDPLFAINAGLIMIEAGRCDRAWELYNATVKMMGVENAAVLRTELDARCAASK